VRVIARHTLVGFGQRHRETEQPLRDWMSIVRRADVKAVLAKASVINRERVVFDVLGGNYRLVVAIKFGKDHVHQIHRYARRVRPDRSRHRQSLLSEAAMRHEIKPIRNDEDHAQALAAVEGLWQAEPGTPEHDRLEVLAMLVDEYESRRWPIEPADPVDVIGYVMEQRGLTRKDLEAALGSRARVSEILNRRRPLTMKMAWRLHRAFGIPADALIRPYELAR